MNRARFAIALAASIAAALLVGPRSPAPPSAPPAATRELEYWWARAVGAQVHNPSPAVLVSRFRFERLEPLRGLDDLARLRAYVEWADRPEAAAFHHGVLEADVSANDLILLRLPSAAVRAPVPVSRDPIGYAVLDPRRTGRVRIPITLLAVQTAVPALPPAPPRPTVHAAVAAASSTVVIYGEALGGGRIRVFSRKGEGRVLYAGPHQVNASVPSLDAVRIESGGFSSPWVEVRR